MLNKIRQIWAIVLSGIIGFLIATVLFLPKIYPSNQNLYRIIRERINVLNQIIGYVNHFYFDSIDMEKIMDGAFHGLMEELDPHSTYIPAKEQENISELFKGKFQGIGIEFDILDGFITVISPVPDSPSDIVGLMPGDKIIAINGDDAYKITKTEVFEKLRGRKGTKVTVTISRLGALKPFDIDIIRDNIPIYSVGAATMIDDSTGYIFLRRFSATTEKEVVAAIDTLIEQGMKKLLFDLRGNSGGYLEQAAAISDQFITSLDTLVYTRGKIKESNQIFMSSAISHCCKTKLLEDFNKNSICPNCKKSYKPIKIGYDNFSIIVMINRGSASASEIVSGAIQDLDRGLIIGETSFGKGLVQRQLPLDTGAAIRVTIARYYTPSGRLIQRPYEDGNDIAYYRELYDVNRESKMDSLKKLRPKYKTKSGRIVYGGGGITPDIYIPYKNSINTETARILRNPKRPFFNFASKYASENLTKEQLDKLKKDEGTLIDIAFPFDSFKNFKNNWKMSESLFNYFLVHLQKDSIEVIKDSLYADIDFIENRMKSELAGSIWGKNASANLRLLMDNQVIEALKHFNVADAFIKSIN